MGRVALAKTKTIIISVIVALVLAGGIVGAVVANSPSHKSHVTLNSQNQITSISYRGQNGQDALSLLKKHARVEAKHYSFGDLVTSINGTPGNGPKYWTLYDNGKMAQVGASSLITKNSDNIEWKLQ